MTHADAFLADILAHPDDDGLRLIYADWLTDHDDPRGEFIRVQCELVKTDTGHEPTENVERWGKDSILRVAAPGTSDYWARIAFLRRRERELLLEGSLLWIEEVIGVQGAASYPEPFTPEVFGWNEDGTDQIGLTFRRGFVEELRLTTVDWCRHADELMVAAPLRSVHLTTPVVVMLQSEGVVGGQLRTARPDEYVMTAENLQVPALPPVTVRFWLRGRKVQHEVYLPPAPSVRPGRVAIGSVTVNRTELFAAEWPQITTWHFPEGNP